jgi:hypothetical protein
VRAAVQRKPGAKKAETLPEVEADAVEFARRRLGFEPDRRQAEVLGRAHHRLLLNCSRQWGKSSIAGIKAVHVALQRAESLVVVVSPTGRQSGEFVQKASRFVQKLGLKVRGDGDNAISLLFPNGSRMVGLPGGSDSNIRGFSAAALIIVDEAAFVDDAVYHAIRPMMAVGGGDLWLLSTPQGRAGFFYQEWANGGDIWTRVSAPATECVRIDAAFLEEERRTMGDGKFRQEYLCEFVDVDGTLFDRDAIERMFRADVEVLRV